MRIDILLPTRGRPHRFTKMVDSILHTAQDLNNMRVIAYVDADDTAMREALPGGYGSFVLYVVGERMVLSKAWNVAFEKGAGEIVMHAGDDIVFTGKHWDAYVREFFTAHDPYWLLHGPDGIQNERLATHSFTTRKAAEARGYFVPPLFAALYNDTWLFDIYTRNGRVFYDPRVIIEHEHFSKYPDRMDATYAERRAEKVKEATQIWACTAPDRVRDARKMMLAAKGAAQ